MTLPDDFREPWFAVLPGTADELEAEALGEIGPDHQLFGLGLRAIARCEGCDNVIFEVSDGSWALVHLTWARTRPEPAPWPSTERQPTLAMLRVDVMDDHEH